MRGSTVPPYLRPGYLVAVAAGGAVGVEARFLITSAVAPTLSQPAITLVINVVGSLVLGVLLEALALHGPDRGVRRTLRLLVGSGFCGGFTTYSTLGVDAATFVAGGRWTVAILYGLGSIVPGVLAAAAGVWLAVIRHRRLRRTGER